MAPFTLLPSELQPYQALVAGPNTYLMPYNNAWYPSVLANGTLWNYQPYVANNWVQSVAFAPQPQSARGALADKIRHALDTAVSLDIKDKPLAEALKAIQQKTPGVPFHTVLPPPDDLLSQEKVTLQLEQVPLGAALQALEDSFPDQRTVGSHDGLRLAVREYGILVTSNRMLPAGATLLHNFWKGQADNKGAGTGGPHQAAGKTPDKNAPPAPVEGVVKAVDPSGLVVISIGSDAGLSKGNTLEVYRLKPKPMYLGTLQIVDVRSKEATGKPTATRGRAIQVGDQVASEVTPDP
jgi:hypothetical protein